MRLITQLTPLGIALLVSAPAPTQEEAKAPFQLDGIATFAEVRGPNDSTFTTEIVSLADGTARMHQSSATWSASFVVTAAEGDRLALSPGDEGRTWEYAKEAMVEFVDGHDVHRLYLETWSASDTNTAPQSITVEAPESLGGGEVVIEFGELRDVLGTQLPFEASFTHDGEVYRYTFLEVLPFRWAPGVELCTEPDALFAQLGDARELLAAHASVMQAHRDHDVEPIAAGRVEVGIDSGRGRLREDTIESMRARLGPYLSNTTFQRYEDVVQPVVAVSKDGSLGWVACEVEAEGIDSEFEAFEFGYSWVELYGERDGAWLRTGVASSGR